MGKQLIPPDPSHVQEIALREALEERYLAYALSTIMKYGISRLPTAQRHEEIERAMSESLIEVVTRIEKRTTRTAQR